MSNGRKQFAVYRLKKGDWENEALRYRSWNYLQKFHIQVQSDRYEQICVSPFSWDLDASDRRRQLENGLPAAPSGEKLEVSDVLAVTKDEIWIDGQHFFLIVMQSQQFGKNAAYVVLDSNGKVAATEHVKGEQYQKIPACGTVQCTIDHKRLLSGGSTA